jgi:hypothetical protein
MFWSVPQARSGLIWIGVRGLRRVGRGLRHRGRGLRVLRPEEEEVVMEFTDSEPDE